MHFVSMCDKAQVLNSDIAFEFKEEMRNFNPNHVKSCANLQTVVII